MNGVDNSAIAGGPDISSDCGPLIGVCYVISVSGEIVLCRYDM